jgi:hypothetical protein
MRQSNALHAALHSSATLRWTCPDEVESGFLENATERIHDRQDQKRPQVGVNERLICCQARNRPPCLLTAAMIFADKASISVSARVLSRGVSVTWRASEISPSGTPIP